MRIHEVPPGLIDVPGSPQRRGQLFSIVTLTTWRGLTRRIKIALA
ncbi:hypothetical protein [Devosia sp. DBB001]|nr:hypothetical protein [Devosia sp. DBB001]